MARKNTILNFIFLAAVFLFLLAGGARAFLLPKAINYYENRTANQMPEATASGILSGDFQDGVEDGLSDQVIFAQSLEKGYYYLTTSFQIRLIQPFLTEHPDRYINVLGVKTFGGSHLVYAMIGLEESRAGLDEHIGNLNAVFAAHPELDFSVYYIERETDLNLETGEKNGISAYLGAQLRLPEGSYGVFTVDSFEEFDEKFYKTDHHWNCYGSYEGYCAVLGLLDSSEEPLEPTGEQMLDYTFSGSRASTIGAKGVFVERFPAYTFDYPAMDITGNGTPMADYGDQEAFLNGTATNSISYSRFYGDDLGEIIFDTHQTDRENLLVLGESYDNAILKLLASHYNRTYSIDLRYYEDAWGRPFSFSEYVEEHDISKVLLIGSSSFFTSGDFILEGY